MEHFGNYILCDYSYLSEEEEELIDIGSLGNWSRR